ncbi:uncharacterized protein LOC116303164 [Actinia tenebrosa]|uniref:Uncharacterized protein LOC116303164 n=1 Tax=Actinia tenebrosa TaxID=6105 RepID=A0A6P8INR6_ACTTE|nr:uncharacterized protein LOC116303164 [Actinia tenebrosa]XP_031568519.1 uncharacterized protein LOC116303164 [Actinia tenebrosa]
MATAFTIVTLLVFLSSLETTESRNTPFQNENSLRRNQPSDEQCAVRRPDGTCLNQWRVGKKEKSGLDVLEKRQAKCDRRMSMNCRMMGRKRALHNIDCTQPEGRRSLLCRKEYYKRLYPSTPCDKRFENCEKLYMYKSAQKSADLETKETQKCDLKSPLCYFPYPGKRKPKQDKDLGKKESPDKTGSKYSLLPETSREEVEEEEVDHKESVTETENNLLGGFFVGRETTKLPYEKEEQEMDGVPTIEEDGDDPKPVACNPKRDYQCRFRIFSGKRDQTFKKAASPKSYK